MTDRIRINLAAGELEIAGSEEFVERYRKPIDWMLDRLMSEGSSASAGTGERSPAPKAGSGPQRIDVKGAEFGEALHQLPADATGTDQILLAGLFGQTASENDTFSTAEANKLLIAQGIKLSNASQALKQNLMARRVFKHEGKYRVSKVGLEYLAKLMGSGEED